MTASGDLDRRYGGGDSQKSEIHGFGDYLTEQNYENSGISRAALKLLGCGARLRLSRSQVV